MDTAQEALFKAMLSGGWFTNSDGEVESPTGFFGYMDNKPNELNEIYEAFEDVVEAYGKPEEDEILGAWVAFINDQGIIYIYGQDSVEQAKEWFDLQVSEYSKWNNN